MPSVSSVRRAGRWDRSTRRMISSFSEAGYLIPRCPHPQSYFFKQAQFQGLLGDDFLQRPGFLSQIPDLAAGRRTRGIAGQPPLAGFQELLRPVVVEALGNALAPAQLRDAVLT